MGCIIKAFAYQVVFAYQWWVWSTRTFSHRPTILSPPQLVYAATREGKSSHALCSSNLLRHSVYFNIFLFLQLLKLGQGRIICLGGRSGPRTVQLPMPALFSCKLYFNHYLDQCRHICLGSMFILQCEAWNKLSLVFSFVLQSTHHIIWSCWVYFPAQAEKVFSFCPLFTPLSPQPKSICLEWLLLLSF